MLGFTGFPDGKLHAVSVPALFFSDLLPQIDHLVELQITLYCFWALNAQEGKYRYLRWQEVHQDELVLAMVRPMVGDPVSLIQDGFERAVARGTLLHLSLKLGSVDENFYFLNTEKGREAVDAIQRGNWLPGDALRPISLITTRPNVYVLYEQNIGALTPLIAQQLGDLERDYSQIWLEEAIKLATNQNIRNLNYIIGVLKRWRRDGRSDAATIPALSDLDPRAQMEAVQRKLGLWEEDDPHD